jgi:hypothetical protein
MPYKTQFFISRTTSNAFIGVNMVILFNNRSFSAPGLDVNNGVLKVSGIARA